MSRNLSISETGLKLIKAFEGYRPVDRVLVTGARVVGYGHRLYSDRPVNMSRDEAETQLREDLGPFEELVNEEVLAPLTQSQFDALVSLAFNIGPKAFRGSDIVRALNNGRPLDAANGFDVWRTSKINGQTYVVDALMRRRTAEKSLFLRTENLPNAPTAMVPPLRDTNFPNVGTGDGLPVYTEADATGSAETVPYALDDAQDNTRRRGEVETPISGVTLSEVLNIEEEDDIDDPEDENADLADEDLILKTEYGQIDADDALIDLDVETSEESLVDPEPSDDPVLDMEDVLADLDKLDTDSTDPVASIEDETTPEQTSAIAEAADQLRERLDSLIDNDGVTRKETPDEPSDSDSASDRWPTSMFNSDDDNMDDDVVSGPAADILSRSDSPETDEGPRSNLLAFPGAARKTQPIDETVIDTLDEQRDEPIAANGGPSLTPVEAAIPSRPMPTRAPDITIDELDADDLLRGTRPQTSDLNQAPKIDIVSQLSTRDDDLLEEDEDGASGLWIPILLGFALLGASVAAGLRGSETLMGDWGPIAVVAGIITGTLMVVFSIYISLTQKT